MITTPVLYLRKPHPLAFYHQILGPDILNLLCTVLTNLNLLEHKIDWLKAVCLAPPLLPGNYFLTIRCTSPFFKSLSRLNLDDLFMFIVHLLEHKLLFHTRHYLTRRRIRSRLLRPNFHPVWRFHTSSPTNPSTPPRLLRCRLKKKKLVLPPFKPIPTLMNPPVMKPSLVVERFPGRPHCLIRISSVWQFFSQNASLFSSRSPNHDTKFHYASTHPNAGFLFNLTSPFGRVILKLPARSTLQFLYTSFTHLFQPKFPINQPPLLLRLPQPP